MAGLYRVALTAWNATSAEDAAAAPWIAKAKERWTAVPTDSLNCAWTTLGLFDRSLDKDIEESLDHGEPQCLGRGRYGETYVVVEKSGLRRQFAAKLLRTTTPAVTHRFAKEAQALHGLNDRRIVALHGVGVFRGRPTIMLQRIGGPTLTDWLCTEAQDNRLTIAVVLSLFIQLLEAIEKTHDQNVFHGDLSPSNVMLQNGEVRIVDFGLASLFSGEQFESAPGTPGYRAPRFITDRSLRDVFSVGALLFSALSACGAKKNAITLPDAGAAEASSWAGLAEAVDREIGAGGDIRLTAIVKSALQLPGTAKYSSITEFRDDLRSYVANGSTQQFPLRPKERLRLLFRDRTAQLVLAGFAGVTLCLAAFAGWKTWDAQRSANRAAVAKQIQVDTVIASLLEDTSLTLLMGQWLTDRLGFAVSRWSDEAPISQASEFQQFLNKRQEPLHAKQPMAETGPLCLLSVMAIREGELKTSLNLLQRACAHFENHARHPILPSAELDCRALMFVAAAANLAAYSAYLDEDAIEADARELLGKAETWLTIPASKELYATYCSSSAEIRPWAKVVYAKFVSMLEKKPDAARITAISELPREQCHLMPGMVRSYILATLAKSLSGLSTDAPSDPQLKWILALLKQHVDQADCDVQANLTPPAEREEVAKTVE